MYITATQMAKKFKIPYQRMVAILCNANVYHSSFYGYWDTTDIFYMKRGNRRTKEVDCFYYDLNKVKRRMSLDIIACGRAVGRSKKTKRYLVRNYGV